MSVLARVLPFSILLSPRHSFSTTNNTQPELDLCVTFKMPSRKRTKGKERKAKLKDSLSLHNATKCRHGSEAISTDHIVYRFVEQFEVEVRTVFNSNATSAAADRMYKDTSIRYSPSSICEKVLERLKGDNQFHEIWSNDTNQQMTLQLLVSLGTNLLLKEETYMAEQKYSSFAASAVAFGTICLQHGFDKIDIGVNHMPPGRDRNFIRDFHSSCFVSDTTRFFKNKIPCKCLKEKYAQIKHVPKFGQCKYCLATKLRKHLYLCEKCQFSHYCSVDCQRCDYPLHKQICK